MGAGACRPVRLRILTQLLRSAAAGCDTLPASTLAGATSARMGCSALAHAPQPTHLPRGRRARLDLAGDRARLTEPAAVELEPIDGGVSPPCLPATIDHNATLPGTAVDVSPEPETTPPTPHTQISFLGVPAATDPRGAPSVGARSGTHGGRLRAYSQGDGASFVPDRPFDARRARAAVAALHRRRRARGTAPVHVRLPRRHPLSDGDRLGVPQPAGGASRLPELRDAARRHRRRS